MLPGESTSAVITCYEAVSGCVGILYDRDCRSPLGGNKGLKLKPHLLQATGTRARGLIGFGGAYSNFILSLAVACHQADLPCIGIIRGDELVDQARYKRNLSLELAERLGMTLDFVTRREYKERYSTDTISRLRKRYPGYIVLAEGGSSLEAAQSCGDLINSINGETSTTENTTHWLVAAGTGATSAGIAAHMRTEQSLIAVTVTKDPAVPNRVLQWAEHLSNDLVTRIRTVPAIQPPAYGRLDKAHCNTINDCFEQTGILLDPVYTVRALHTLLYMPLNELLHSDVIKPTLVHTGGLSGWLGLQRDWKNWLSTNVLTAIEQLHDDYLSLRF